ncbi:hypothetical protein [Streptomyces sp. Ncost-T10-10d]|uniref:hypothetical protein n=1 Tax=Streptomyces sp. Ncost-T10-10d TaxID=1839774 RepID=UPI00210BD7A8|nr:hypothetical protein [Streptomyces sp. Ncost-T10-10d]
MELTEDRVAAVAPQHLRPWGLETADLVPVAEHELPGLQRQLQPVRPGDAASFDGWMADAVAIAEMLGLGGQRVTVLPPDRGHTGKVVVRGAGPIEGRLQPLGVRRDCREHHMDIRRAQRCFPVLGAALTDIAQCSGPGGHPLPELPGERVQ